MWLESCWTGSAMHIYGVQCLKFLGNHWSASCRQSISRTKSWRFVLFYSTIKLKYMFLYFWCTVSTCKYQYPSWKDRVYMYVCNKYPSNILLVCLLYFCHQILPSAVDMLREFPGQNLRISLPCIQFIYWALIHVENCAGQQVIKHLLNLVFNEMANLASFYNWHLTVRLVLRFNR